jgi:excisionase family DNA binding protein
MKPPELDDALLSKTAVASWLGVSTRKIEYMMERQGLPFLKLGHRTVRFRRADVSKWLKKSTSLRSSETLSLESY